MTFMISGMMMHGMNATVDYSARDRDVRPKVIISPGVVHHVPIETDENGVQWVTSRVTGARMLFTPTPSLPRMGQNTASAGQDSLA